jgi:glycosyltransferase involved in cell wall biosynthesis
MNEPINEDWFSDKSIPLIIAAGNLVPWKGFSDLIIAMQELLKLKKARLVILGDGPLKDELNELIERLGLKHFVKLQGFVDNPLKYFQLADIFVLSSLVEGLPNVLVEAMMCGCTPVATNCPTGPREVLQDGRFGYLVPIADPSALAAGIARAIDCPIPDDLLREAVRPFGANVILKKHFDSLKLTA